MLILGLDPGLTRCGVGLVVAEGRKSLQFVEVGVLRSPANADLTSRLTGLGKELEVVLDRHMPDAIALERVFSQQNVSTVMGTAQISGVVMYLAGLRNIPVTLYTPTQVKASVTGYGSADKKQVTAMVTKILRLPQPPKPADAADALALAIAHAWAGEQVTKPSQHEDNADGSARPTPAQLAWHAAEQRAKNRSRP